ncbi:MAG: hypothetical protein GX758_00290 [Tenericutes bacterium]|nr:hypothetical protein [Mycoplasmatota bacterium]
MKEKLKKDLFHLYKTTSFIKKKTKTSFIVILIDILWCYIFYSANYNEYRIFEFYKISHKNRKTYLTKRKYYSIIRNLNNSEDINILKNQSIFYEKFNKYLKREIYDISKMSFKESELFLKNNPEIICTSYDSNSKYEKLNVKDYRSPAFMIEYMKQNKLFIMQKPILEHKMMVDINKYSMNYISIVTLYYNDDVNIIFSSIKFGSKDEYIYNIDESNPIMGKIDEENSCIYTICKDEKGMSYKEHPITKIKFDKYKVPRFNEALNLVKSLAKQIQDVKLIEWRIMISKTGPILMEAVQWEDYYFSQLSVNNKNKEGLLPLFNKILK